MDEKWAVLQNGSDIRGVSLKNEFKKETNLTEDKVRIIGCAFAKWIADKKGKKLKDIKISIGTDSRISALGLKKALMEGITSLGCNVCDFGMCTTPAMFMSTVMEGYKYDGAVMITASHLPYYYNGLKFFTSIGGAEKEDIKKILEYAERKDFVYEEDKGSVSELSFINIYSDMLIKKIREGVNSKIDYEKPLKGFKIVVDAGNGAGGFFATNVLPSLGADTSCSQFIDPDGMFPNHIPNPEVKAAMDSLKEGVLKAKGDLGIIFDADVDRAALVDSEGAEINRNALIALISSIVLEDNPHSTIVTDSVTSTGLQDFIENKLGGVHHRFKRGYRNVINESIRLNKDGTESSLAIETSGHAALKENYFLDDGAYLISKILIKAAKLKIEGKNINSLISELKMPYESKEIRMKLINKDFREYGLKIIQDINFFIENEEGWSIVPNNYEGIRVACDSEHGDGWFLLRMSLHEPVMPLNVESDSKGGTDYTIEKLKTFFQRYDKVDISMLQ